MTAVRRLNHAVLYVRDARKERLPVRLLSPEESSKFTTDERVAHYARALGFQPFVVGKDALFKKAVGQRIGLRAVAGNDRRNRAFADPGVESVPLEP